MAKKKEYTVVVIRGDKEWEHTGTVEELVRDVFGYTLECGASYQYDKGCCKVNKNPKTIKSLITALNNASYNTMGSCYNRKYYKLKED